MSKLLGVEGPWTPERERRIDLTPGEGSATSAPPGGDFLEEIAKRAGAPTDKQKGDHVGPDSHSAQAEHRDPDPTHQHGPGSEPIETNEPQKRLVRSEGITLRIWTASGQTNQVTGFDIEFGKQSVAWRLLGQRQTFSNVIQEDYRKWDRVAATKEVDAGPLERTFLERVSRVVSTVEPSVAAFITGKLTEHCVECG